MDINAIAIELKTKTTEGQRFYVFPWKLNCDGAFSTIIILVSFF